MLGENTIFTTIAVTDIDIAEQFYGQTLGLLQVDEIPLGITYRSGTGRLFIYEAPTAGTNEATYAAWEVDDLEDTIDALKSKGVVFEQYDLPDMNREGDVHVVGSMKTAWFKDPDGNILAISSTIEQ